MFSEEELAEIDPFALGEATGPAIKEYLLTVGRGNSYAFFKLFRQVKKTTSYDSVRRYFWMLRKIGLIRPAGTEARAHGWRKHMYTVTPGKEEDPAWWHCQGELYNATRVGRSYSKLKAEGKLPSGRTAKYRRHSQRAHNITYQ